MKEIQASVLENDILKVIFDAQTGALLNLEDKRTGWNIQKRPELALSFRMLIPLPGKRNNPVLGEKQKLTSMQEDKKENRIIFIWENIKSEYGETLDITLKAIVTLDDNGLTFNSEIKNNSSYQIETLSYPCFGDVPLPSPEEKLVRINWGYAGMSKTPLLPEFYNEQGYFGVDYPIQMVPTPYNPFVLIASDKKGLYAGCHDTGMNELVQFTFELKPGYKETSTAVAPDGDEIGGLPVHLEFTVIHFPFASPGECINLSPIIINPYSGSWHTGADCYKKWRSTWFTPPHTPEWARDIHSWQQIHINSPEDELRCQYKDLIKYGEDCAKNGVKAIQLVGWSNGGQDRGNPSHDTDPRLGTWEELRDAIDKIHEMGVKVVLFNKYTWADRSLEWFRKELIKYAAKDPYGDYYVFPGYKYQTPTQLSDINTRRLIPMCMNSKEWRDICSNEFKKGIELGAAGMLYDECQHHGGVYYCFDSTHNHHIPANIYAGDASLCEDFHSIADKMSPDYLFAGEACYDLEYRYYSISYFRIRTLNHIALQRYIDPYAGIMVAVYGYDDRNVLNQCLLYRYMISYEPLNFKGRLDEFPLTIEYGKKIDTLRKRYKDFLWDAEFIDTLEAQVTTNGKPHTPYSVYRQPSSGKRAVVVANYDEKEEIEIDVRLDNFSGTFIMVIPEQQEPKESNGKVSVPSRSAVVLMENCKFLWGGT